MCQKVETACVNVPLSLSKSLIYCSCDESLALLHIFVCDRRGENISGKAVCEIEHKSICLGNKISGDRETKK